MQRRGLVVSLSGVRVGVPRLAGSTPAPLTMTVLDLETHLIAPGCTFPRIVCGAFDGEGLLDRPRTVERVAEALAKDEGLEGHNVAFDLGCIGAAEPSLMPTIFSHYRKGLVRCTQVRGWLIDAQEGCLGKLGPYSLSRLHERAFGVPLDKGEDTWRLRYAELDGAPLDRWPEAARAYPLEDVNATARLLAFQDRFAEFLDDEFRQARSSFALALTAGWGLVPDQRRVDAFEIRWRARLEEINATLRAAGIVRSDGSQDKKATQARIVAAYGDGAPRTDKGNVKCDKVTCREAPNGDPVLLACGELGPTRSQINRNLPLLRHGIIHTRYGFAASGRTTSGEGDDEDGDGNVQNLDGEGGTRECFVPRLGYVFACVDFGALELCTFAQVELDLFGSSRIAEALNRGEDPHTSFACTMLDLPYDRGVALHKDLDPAFEQMRDVCKIGNFGFLGGLGAASFVAYAFRKSNGKVRLTEAQARDFKAGWLRRWETRRYFDLIGSVADTSGRWMHHRSRRWRGRMGFTDLANNPFQGLGSDAARAAHAAVVEATFTIGSPLWGSHVVNFVHDSVDTEVPENRAHEAATEQARIMVAEARAWLPDVRVKAEPLLTRCLSKKAKPLRDASGRLIPWSDA